MQKSPDAGDRLLWYKDAIIYELHIKAFRDGNNDGVGDFGGLLQTLDYLQDLGVTAIWLLPFYPSPLRDDGYDIADYYSVNPAFGDVAQFRRFLEEAHRRNLRVITELVMNHTSDQHPWFQRARRSPAGSPERDYYVWSDDPAKYKDVRIIFQDYEPSNWSYDPVAKQYYWHRFFHHQPDLNYDNPVVQDEMLRIIDYWCGMGVDGFRLDAIPYLFEREGTNGENLPETHDFLKKVRAHVDRHFPGTLLLAEANMWPEEAAAYFGEGDECQMNYHFPVMPRIFMAVQMEDRYPITDIFDQTPAIPANCQWAIFLRNHDELTLEMVTDEERDYMYKVYAKDPRAKINLGIRHRLVPLVGNNRQKTELLNSLLFSLPGTPVIYYGDEIGMGDNVYLGDRDGVRTPMQWSPDRNAGFSGANPQKLYLPLILDPEYHYESVNVETQRQNTSSLFWFMKRMIALRKKYRAFGRGDMTFLNIDNPKILAFTRCFGDETILVIANLSRFSQPAGVELASFRGYKLTEMASRNDFPAVPADGNYLFTMAPYAFHWFTLEKVSEETIVPEKLPLLRMGKWEDMAEIENIQYFEQTLLPAWLTQQRWFNGLGKSVYSLAFDSHSLMTFGDTKVWWMLVDTIYKSGLPETYQIAVTFVGEADAEKIRQETPHALLAQMELAGVSGYLCDGFYYPSLQLALIDRMAGQSAIPLDKGRMDFYGNAELKAHWQERDEIRSRLATSDQANTSITYDNRFFLKMYRKVDPSVNPDLEITRYLTNEAHFTHMPAFIGAIEWKYEGEAIVLGILQEMIENHGDGQRYVTERMSNFIDRVLARDRQAPPAENKGALLDPVPFDALSEETQLLLGGAGAEQADLLGRRTGEMHLALASGTANPDFRPEWFSMHYQRSLFSFMQSLVRETYQHLARYDDPADQSVQARTALLLRKRGDILASLRRINLKKFDVIKTRIHGYYHLSQVLLTGKDLAIHDYGGDPAHSYSERRLKRSPVRDIASMMDSFYHVAYRAFRGNNHIPKERAPELMPWYAWWAQHMSGFFLLGWTSTVQGSPLVPADANDRRTMLEIYLLQQALRDLNYQLTHRSREVAVASDFLLAII